MSSSAPSKNSAGMSLTIRPSTTASLGGLPLRSTSTLTATPAHSPASQQAPAPAPAPGFGTSFVLSSSRSNHLRLLSPEAIARHALGSPSVPVRGPPRLAEGFIPFPAPAPPAADDPRVVFANTTPETHRSPSKSSEPAYTHTYGSGYIAHSNGAGPGPSTAAAWRGAAGAGRLSTIQEGSSHRSLSPPPAAVPAPLSISRESSRTTTTTTTTTSDGGVSAASAATSPISAVSELSGSADISVGASTKIKSIRSRPTQKPWAPSPARGKSVDASLSFADFTVWNVRSEDFGQSKKEARRNCADSSPSTAGSGSTGPQPELVRQREEDDNFGRELDELESVVSDMSEKLAALHFVGREDLLSPDSGESLEASKTKDREREKSRRERREAKRMVEKDAAPETPIKSKSPQRPPLSRKSSSSGASGLSASSARFRAGPAPPLVFSAS
ncbi:unnamed protein product [Peniophora sp. CBMAI 1063]|nr:unnamed protein product [Peniophora sp. CBMAI 1063]